jgi:Acyl-CoA reductase (LuxC)
MWWQVMLHEIKILNHAAKLECIERSMFLSKVVALQNQAVMPFAAKSIALLADLSKGLLASPEARAYPQFTALGYWLRPSMLQRMKQSFDAEIRPGQTPTPRGMALHLPPQNVDTLFVYSWALSVLAGNANIVRLPSSLSDTTDFLCRMVNASLLASKESERHIFCNYDHHIGINASISALCDLRMVWGGDEKVLAVSADTMRPDGISVGFPDRQSFAVVDAQSYLALETTGRDRLAANFYNDIYWFDQLGCGSPRIVFWVGDATELADDLFSRIAHVAEMKSYPAQVGVSLGKFALMNDMLAEGVAQQGHRFGPELDVVKALPSAALATKFHGGGFLVSVEVAALQDISMFVGKRTQTIAYFGFEKVQLKQLSLSLIGKGGYRIVPIGEALSFEATWDGIDLMRQMTRLIVVR